MSVGGKDPYAVLGVNPSVSDEELRAAYRRLVQLHHPDHNNGSPESERRFEQIQEAYAAVRELRDRRGGGAQRRRGAARQGFPPPTADPDLDARLADMERELREAEAARQRSRQAAREAQAARDRARQAARDAARSEGKRPTDEELGYYSTDDSFTKILDDTAARLSQRFGALRDHPITDRVADVLDDLAAKLKRGDGNGPSK